MEAELSSPGGHRGYHNISPNWVLTQFEILGSAFGPPKTSWH
jgi:hypothetical protein